MLFCKWALQTRPNASSPLGDTGLITSLFCCGFIPYYFLKCSNLLRSSPFFRHTLECFPQVNIGLSLNQTVLSVYILHKCMLINKLASLCIAHKAFLKEDLGFIECKIWILLYLSYCSFVERWQWVLECYASYTCSSTLYLPSHGETK